MMKNQGEKLYGSTASGKVMPLFSHTDATSSSGMNLESLIPEALSHPVVETRLKSIVESAVLDAWMRARWGHVDRQDDPFDAVYISELRPDEVEKADIMAFLQHSDIVDLSDTISFVDEWED